ncbi:MAG: peptidoglycan DD-metalloendopeptidase family protein [Thermoanaerobaculales bacterium]|jgi:septal ring factor EnvC (AmiA/AmiB activator)|nr:peptidoglycan DD-metalloendopeptidase family protein [Thermoanaerobaculales bacterium]
MTARVVVVALVVLIALGSDAAPPPTTEQLEIVRRRIGALEGRLAGLADENRSRHEERERLTAELELAEARVAELELVLERSRREAAEVAGQAEELARGIAHQKELLAGQVEVVALLGRPGSLQLLFDGARGGDLEGAIAMVAALTSGRIELVREYDELQRVRSARLAELSRILDQARAEAEELAIRRSDLEAVRQRVDREIGRLDSTERSARSELDELRQREQALENLLETLTGRRRFTGRDDIRSFRGALPWPARGPVVRGFGRKMLPNYSTYTVCNGLWFDSPSGSEVTAVFPGEVAYARFFKGYGNMVVIDHGHEVYSLAAGLATIHVRVNQRVDMGLRLGLASPPGDDGNTYFEIRVGKKAEDPRRWLQLRSSDGSSGR